MNAPTQRKEKTRAVCMEDDAGQNVPVRSSGQHTDGAVAADATTEGDDVDRREESTNASPSNRCASANGRRHSTADRSDVVEAVVEAAHHLADHSAIPGVSEAAKLVSILVGLVTDYRGVTSEVEWKVRRCRSIVFMLERAGEVLGKVRRRMSYCRYPTNNLPRCVSRVFL